jgi:hypothetical protein
MENIEITIKKHNRILLRIGLWSLIPLNLGMKLFKKLDERSQAVRFFQYKTGRSIFDPECWKQYRMNYCHYSFE